MMPLLPVMPLLVAGVNPACLAVAVAVLSLLLQQLLLPLSLLLLVVVLPACCKQCFPTLRPVASLQPMSNTHSWKQAY
jgi:hypothetical protein